MKEMLRRYHKKMNNNRGVGIVTVVIVIAFLIILGSLILFTSYSGVREKTSAREGEELFYDAETAMNEIAAGLQEKEANAFKSAYESAMALYATQSDKVAEMFETTFLDSFNETDEITKKSIVTLVKDPLTGEYLSEGSYSCEALKGMVKATEGVEVTVSSGNAEQGVLRINSETAPTTITFENVCVTATMPNDRVSKVSADISMVLPSFDYIKSQYSLSGIMDFGIVAKNGVTVNGLSDVTVNGDAYVGKVDIASNKTFNVENGTFICKDYVTVQTGGVFGSETTSKLWVGGFDLDTNGSLAVKGNTNVADDLQLSGNGSKASLSGEYFGFGYSKTNSDLSSSILANGKNTELTLDNGLSALTLAGYTFVDFRSASDSDSVGSRSAIWKDPGVRMGESMSVKSNQQVYLAPTEIIRFIERGTDDVLATVQSNPTITSDPGVLLNARIITNDRTLTGATLKPVAIPLNQTQYIVYFFLEFSDPAEASAYFKKYFEENSSKLERYLDSYMTVSALDPTILNKADTTGYIFTNTNDTENHDIQFNEAIKAASESQARDRSTTFKNLCQWLTTYKVGEYNEENSPYEYYVKGDPETLEEFVDGNGRTVAVAAKNFTYTGSDGQEDICLIIASGDVEIESDFNGMILCKGTVTLDADVTAPTDDSDTETNKITALDIARASLAENTVGENIGDKYLNIPFATIAEGSETSQQSNFDITVTLDNWRKN